MNIKLTLMCLFLLATLNTIAQSNRVKKSRVALGEKQNKPAANIPEILLEAYSKGEISAYYPSAQNKRVPYSQFLYHFGMEAKANIQVEKGSPYWFCNKEKPVAIDQEVMDCMKYSFEIGEESYRNNITYQLDKRMIYVKVIYSNECTDDGLEIEGPVFRISDIRKLNERRHKIVNAQNSAVSYTISDYLALRLFRSQPIK